MVRRRIMTAVAVAAVAVAGCGKPPAKPGDPAAFLAPLGSIIAPICTLDNDGQRFTLDGYLGLPQTINVEGGSNATAVDFYAKGPGDGRAVSVDVTLGKHVEVKTGKEKLAPGYKRTQADIVPDSFRVLTSAGPVTDHDRVRVTVEVKTVQHFQTKAITACSYQVTSIEKL